MFCHSCQLDFPQHVPAYNNAHNLLRRICLFFWGVFVVFFVGLPSSGVHSHRCVNITHPAV